MTVRTHYDSGLRQSQPTPWPTSESNILLRNHSSSTHVVRLSIFSILGHWLGVKRGRRISWDVWTPRDTGWSHAAGCIHGGRHASSAILATTYHSTVMIWEASQSRVVMQMMSPDTFPLHASLTTSRSQNLFFITLQIGIRTSMRTLPLKVGHLAHIAHVLSSTLLCLFLIDLPLRYGGFCSHGGLGEISGYTT